MKQLVSICIPNYNAGAFIGETIKSALDQTYTRIEIIVIDDCSTDDSWVVINSFGLKVKKFRNKRNLGYPGNMNRCVELAKGDYIIFLNSDDILEKNAVKKQLEVMAKNPGVGVVHGAALKIDACGRRIGVIKSSKTSYVMRGMERLNTLLEGNSIVCSAAMVRKKCFRDAGVFDPGIYFCADWDMWLRICMKHDIAYLDGFVALYRVRENSMSSTYGTVKMGGVDKYKTLKKTLSALSSRHYVHDSMAQRIVGKSRHYYSVLAVEQIVKSLQLTSAGYPAYARKHVILSKSVCARPKFIIAFPLFYALTFCGRRVSSLALMAGKRIIKEDMLYTASKN